jgi:phage baseplate assembly protein W
VARSFRSTGRPFTVSQPASYQSPIIPVGIKTPLSLSGNGVSTPFTMNTKVEDQIADNLRNLIMTNYGERLGLYDFGGNLQSLLMETIPTADLPQAVETRIKTAVDKYMPGIDINSVSMIANRSPGKALASFDFVVTYSCVQAGINERRIQINLTAAG